VVLVEVGSRIIDLVGDGTTVNQLVDHLLTEYEVEPSTLTADVTDFVDQMIDAGILVPVADPG